MLKDRVAIVGVGNVGATTAYALLLSGLAPDVVLINRDRNKAEYGPLRMNSGIPLAHPICQLLNSRNWQILAPLGEFTGTSRRKSNSLLISR